MAVHPSNNNAPEKKRRNPPTFRHLPQNRAKKLKKAWVEKRKLKAQWKAQKRKEGLLVPELTGLTRDVENRRTEKRKAALLDVHVSEDEDDGELSRPQSGASSPVSTPIVRDADEGYDEENDTRPKLERPRLPRKRARTTVPQVKDASQSRSHRSGSRLDKPEGNESVHPSIGDGKPSSTSKTKADGEDRQDKTSLRELTRRAYAPSSLHTFKSDPLHRRKSAFTKETAFKLAAPPVSSSRSADRNRGGRGERLTGRGQPNMKLRMEAMLERIKRDYS